MKVYYKTDSDKRKFEGRTTLSRQLKEFLTKHGVTFVDNPKDADLLHFHSSGIMQTYQAARMKKELGVPCIYSLYSVSHTEPIGHLKNRLLQRVYFHKTKTNALLSYSAVLPLKLRAPKIKELDAFVTLTGYVKKRSFRNTKVIRAGIDVNRFKPLPKKLSKRVKVAFFGHPTVQKGLSDFVKATARLPDLFEVHVCPSKMTPKIAAFVIKHNPRAHIHGYIEDIHQMYNNMDVIVLPYRSKISSIANPLVLLEAMACEKTIITTTFGFVKEIVKDTALLVKPDSPKSLARAIRKTADPALRKVLGKKARARVLEEFDQKDTHRQYLALYKNLLNGKIQKNAF